MSSTELNSERFLANLQRRADFAAQLQPSIDLIRTQLRDLETTIPEEAKMPLKFAFAVGGVSADINFKEGVDFASTLIKHLSDGETISTFFEKHPECSGLDLGKVLEAKPEIGIFLAPPPDSQPQLMTNSAPSLEVVAVPLVLTEKSQPESKDESPLNELRELVQPVNELLSNGDYWVDYEGKQWVTAENVKRLFGRKGGTKVVSDEEQYVSLTFASLFKDWLTENEESRGKEGITIPGMGNNHFFSREGVESILLFMAKRFEADSRGKLDFTIKENVEFDVPGKKPRGGVTESTDIRGTDVIVKKKIIPSLDQVTIVRELEQARILEDLRKDENPGIRSFRLSKHAPALGVVLLDKGHEQYWTNTHGLPDSKSRTYRSNLTSLFVWNTEGKATYLTPDEADSFWKNVLVPLWEAVYGKRPLGNESTTLGNVLTREEYMDLANAYIAFCSNEKLNFGVRFTKDVKTFLRKTQSSKPNLKN